MSIFTTVMYRGISFCNFRDAKFLHNVVLKESATMRENNSASVMPDVMSYAVVCRGG